MAGQEISNSQKAAPEVNEGEKPEMTLEKVGLTNFMLAAIPGYGERPANSGQSSTARLRSYLDHAVHPLADAVTSSDKASDEMSGYLRGFIKTVPLFLKGRTSLPLLALTYMSDEAKLGDTAHNQAIDAGLGLGKGAILKTSLSVFHGRSMTPASTGMGLGIINRGSETLLTRNNYYDAKGEFSLNQGLKRTASVVGNPGALAVDALTFGVNDMMFATMFNKTRGMVAYRPSVTYTMSAGTMGLTSGFGQELERQLREDKQLDPTQLARRAFLQGVFDAAGGRVGAWQATRGTHLQPDAPGAMEKARSTPYQRGLVADERQTSLRDGTFIADRQATGLHTETWFGRVKTESGEMIPAVFRPNDKTEAFAARMQAEIAGYGMNGLGFKTNVPATVARVVELNGKPYSGYIQEMSGPNLVEHFRAAVPHSESSAFSKTLEHFRASAPLSTSYRDAFTHRMIMAEWDNHAMNMSVSNNKVHNIDLGYSFRVPKTTLEFTPLPQARKAFETMSQGLYGEISGKPLAPEARTEVRSLYERYSTADGRAQLESLGLTPRQVDGVLGRTQWFADKGIFPHQQESMFYTQLVQVSQFAKSVLKKNNHKPVADPQGDKP
ncbi:MAG: hypothetical protein IT343_13080 [Candidatus Melainabacteria bacterium]|jgi:hypothetical protein|nr:hypothetical protein [Candidatus Melainabacteria bacterium]